jgi:hypothetical protein
MLYLNVLLLFLGFASNGGKIPKKFCNTGTRPREDNAD